jgi:hypothetical protein
VPAQFDYSRQLAALLVGTADRLSLDFIDHEHAANIVKLQVQGK